MCIEKSPIQILGFLDSNLRSAESFIHETFIDVGRINARINGEGKLRHAKQFINHQLVYVDRHEIVQCLNIDIDDKNLRLNLFTFSSSREIFRSSIDMFSCCLHNQHETGEQFKIQRQVSKMSLSDAHLINPSTSGTNHSKIYSHSE